MGESAANDGSARDCVLGITQSIGGKRWEARVADERIARALAQRLGVPEIVGRVMAGRGVALDGADSYLNPSLKRDLPDPAGFKDMEVAAERLARAVSNSEPIAIFADYDVDGATSAAVLSRFLRSVGARPRLYVPDRVDEGYGPNEAALKRLFDEGFGLVVCVDCGTTAFAPLEYARELGMEIVVVDHHEAESRLPPAVAVVNPNRLDEPPKHGQLAAVGVVFLLAVAINRRLRALGFYGGGAGEPDLRRWLDLVALGTVCDVVPLTGVNRALVARGLEVLARRENAGLSALCDVARMDEAPTPFHLGFLLGPRINAGGRLGRADTGVRLLTTDSAEEAAELAGELDRLNDARKDLEARTLEEALRLVESDSRPEGMVFVAGQGWHPGVIGIVANRLMERYSLPAVVVALDEHGAGKGSGRSVPGVDLGAAVIAARQAGVLREGGGHAMAAGLSVSAEDLGKARAFLQERLSRSVSASGYVPALGLDAMINPRGASIELVRTLARLGPFGAGNAEPRFAIANANIVNAEVVGQRHVRFFLGGADGVRLKAIAFRAVDGPLGRALLNSRGLPLHVAGKLRLDYWAGRHNLHFIVEDAAVPTH